MTDWANFLADPRTIRAIFGDAPSLDQVELLSLVLDPQRGTNATLRILLADAEFPADPPPKWRQAGFNRVVIDLLCVPVRALDIRGLEYVPILDLKIGREGDLLRVQGATNLMSIDIRSDYLMVTSDSVTAHLSPDHPVL